MPKTVFFGGTFNPPHISHRLMLEAVAGLDDVEKVLVVPTNIPPHKSVAEFTASEEDRLFMCQLLAEGIEKAEVSDIEFRRGGKSYSFDTLTALKPLYDELYMLIGGDMIATFTTWYRYLDILKLCGIIAVRRKGIDDLQFDNAVEELRLKGGNIEVIEASLPEVSSTELREALQNGEKTEQTIESIAQYIAEKGLYRRCGNEG